jgi:hypothetical protein
MHVGHEACIALGQYRLVREVRLGERHGNGHLRPSRQMTLVVWWFQIKINGPSFPRACKLYFSTPLRAVWADEASRRRWRHRCCRQLYKYSFAYLCLYSSLRSEPI